MDGGTSLRLACRGVRRVVFSAMGLLDDAIREHLELKRRRGADPTEVSRQESEALGPVRRDRGAPADEAPLDAAPVEEPELEDELDDEYDEYDEPGEYEPAGPAMPYDAAADAESPGAVARPVQDGPPTEFVEPPPAGGRAAEEWGFEDEEPEVEEPEAAEPDEDVLEETPEFLQETPEHDRLWFEQKPPRDFDF
jgi:hypothetical protein